jgi:hypothetical protein
MLNTEQLFKLHTLQSRRKAEKQLQFATSSLTAEDDNSDLGKSAYDSSLVSGNILSSYAERFNALFSISNSRELAAKYATNFVYAASAISLISAHTKKNLLDSGRVTIDEEKVQAFYDLDLINLLVNVDIDNRFFLLPTLREMLVNEFGYPNFLSVFVFMVTYLI